MFLLRALRLKGSFRIKAVDDLFKADASEKAVEAYIAKAYAASKLAAEPALADLLKKTPDEIRAAKDPPGRGPGQDHGTAPVQHAVDIRYVLWVTQKFGGAGFLLEEMGIK